MAAFFGFVGQDMPLDDCSVAADLKLALAFQGPHPGILVLGQKQPLIKYALFCGVGTCG